MASLVYERDNRQRRTARTATSGSERKQKMAVPLLHVPFLDGLGWTGPEEQTANFVDAAVNLIKQFEFEDCCNLEFNDSSYEPKLPMSQNDRRAL